MCVFSPAPLLPPQVVHSLFQPAGLMGRLCAPRDMVLLRSWRQDQDGTFIVVGAAGCRGCGRAGCGGRAAAALVCYPPWPLLLPLPPAQLYQSTNHRKARPAGGGFLR